MLDESMSFDVEGALSLSISSRGSSRHGLEEDEKRKNKKEDEENEDDESSYDGDDDED